MQNDAITLGKLAGKFNLNRETLRYYERAGLIQPAKRSEAGYRIYDASSEKIVSFIIKAKSLGFTLNEIKALISLRVTSVGSCDSVKGKAGKKISEIDKKIKDLRNLRKSLQSLVTACEAGKASTRCPIIDNLES